MGPGAPPPTLAADGTDMPWQIVPVEYSRASISCDWFACTNRINLREFPADYDAEIRELAAVRSLAERRGWRVDRESFMVTCPDHTSPENKDNL